MKEFLTSPQAIAAIVSAVTSIAVLCLTLFTKNFIEKKLLIFKLDTEHKFEQRKKIKNVLATNKSHLLNACENLNHRLWNFYTEDHYSWLVINGNYSDPEFYYFHSFVYRILAVKVWMHKIHTELIHLDTTIATKEDLELIKFMRFYGRIFSDTAFFKDYTHNYQIEHDHIFKNNLDELYECIIRDDKILSYDEYLKKITELTDSKLTVFYKLIDGVRPNEVDRHRWEWFQILKMLNLAFLNAYGYDYQQTSDKKMLHAIKTPQRSKFYANFIFLLKEHKLENQKEIKHLIKLLQMP